MISVLTMTLQPSKALHLNHNSSSLFHGMMMEYLSPEVRELLHTMSLRPYRQGLSFGKEGVQWTLCTLTAEAKEHMITPFLSEEVSSFFMKHYGSSVDIVDKNLTSLTYDALIESSYLTACSRELTLHFLSPTAFKSGGEYIFLPDIRLILQSAMKKFDAFSSQTEIFSEDLLLDLEKHCKLSHYRLESQRFHLEGTRVPAFHGRMSLYIKGPQPLVNVVHMLCSYGQYAGVGIKSALGMGSMVVVKK